TAVPPSPDEPPRPRPAPAPAPDTDTPPPPSPAPPPEVRRDAHYPSTSALVVADWLASHAATAQGIEKTCWDLGDRVGVPARPGLLCLRTSSHPAREQARIYRLEDGHLRVVWEGPVGTWANWLELTPLLADDGATLTVHEARPGACGAALDEYRAKEDSGVPMDWGGVLREGCALVGTYQYDGTRYVKAQ
ncbi:MAG: hypothetical protein FJ104_08335, partial [Deltaproteobacteria bacterium]|nr:hypothetical protein [Deltaproteobacteria bacterium]